MSGAPNCPVEDIPEITPEMVEAGERALDRAMDWGTYCGGPAPEGARGAGWVEEVYRAMEMARRGLLPADPPEKR